MSSLLVNACGDDESLSMGVRTNKVCSIQIIQSGSQSVLGIHSVKCVQAEFIIGYNYVVTHLEENASSPAWSSDLGWSANESIRLGIGRQLYS